MFQCMTKVGLPNLDFLRGGRNGFETSLGFVRRRLVRVTSGQQEAV